MSRLLSAAIIGLALFAAMPSHAQVLETVRVRLPNGQYLTLDDSPDRPWYRDQRVTVYQRYYYEPRQRAYVVYRDDDRRYKKHYKHRENHWCPPGQARHGRC